MNQTEAAALSQIADEPTEVFYNGAAETVWLGPVNIDGINSGDDFARRSMVSVSDTPPEGAVGIGDESWTVTSMELPGGRVAISELVKE